MVDQSNNIIKKHESCQLYYYTQKYGQSVNIGGFKERREFP